LGEALAAQERDNYVISIARAIRSTRNMTDQDKRGLTKTRIFLLIFFGLAILLSITTILGTWDEQKNGVISPQEMQKLTDGPPAK
jgi:hypothetical protein